MSNEHATYTSDDGRITASCVAHGLFSYGCTVFVDNRYAGQTDGTLYHPSLLEQVAQDTALAWRTQFLKEGPPPPLVMVESDGQQVPWVEMARNARIIARMSLVKCRDAIRDRTGEHISITELSAWERGEIGLPERRIVDAWADVFGISGPAEPAVTS